MVSGMVAQVVACDGDEYHAVGIEGHRLFSPLSWLLLLAGWKYLPKVDNGKIRVVVQSPEGIDTELTERAKMHYLDHDTFWAVLSDVWKRHAPTNGMTLKQLRELVLVRSRCSTRSERNVYCSGSFYSLSGNESGSANPPEKDR